jgi:hypothetical protein
MTGATIEVVSGEQLRVASVASASAKLDDQKPANNFITSDVTSAPKMRHFATVRDVGNRLK